MNGFRRTLRASTVGCALCLGMVVPMALPATAAAAPALSAETLDTIDELNDDGVFRPAEPDDGLGPDWLSTTFPHVNGDTIVVVTPGTDDGSMYPRIRGLRAGRQTLVIDYPEALGPLISGRSGAILPFFAPSYDASRDVAVDNNLKVMRAFAQQTDGPPYIVYTGYSQGAEALGNAAEVAVGQPNGIDVDNSMILLISDPRSPWGLKAWADNNVAGSVFELFGAESNGARDPGATGDDLPVVSVIVVGDPVANFQWRTLRPVSSLLVNAAGFIAIHSGLGEENYGNLIDYTTAPTTMKSRDGNTTYVVYQPKHHPLTLVAMILNDAVGIKPSEADLERWDAVNNAFYPLVTPIESNAAVPVESSSEDDLPTVARLVDSADSEDPPTESPAPAPTVGADVPASDAEVLSGGRHRAPETADADTPTPEATPSEGGRHRLTGSGRHAADTDAADTDSADGASTDTSTSEEDSSDVSNTETESDSSSDSGDGESTAAA
ncbi:PE-PPE domain-containing protein [Gordonia sp. JH63]|uniref:PE-PPE domain-containing protein n=1 Tax=Gordonia sp. JH63 TaxID=2698900 RepID=UPI00132044B9|nr:PE-PPE domain-containing protein [Gordonia sp. JH63]QHD84914.1 PE-PPE domain-containing protein [Gordonia sp. JH63]